jgi:hypothetical protein
MLATITVDLLLATATRPTLLPMGLGNVYIQSVDSTSLQQQQQ